MAKTAISYIRFSTPEQAKGNSFRRQIEDSQAWCDRNGYKLDTSFKIHDLGLSGFKGRNAKTGKLKAFLDELEAGRIKADALIIESLDRLSRDEVGDALRLFLNILSHKIKIITTKPENIFDQKSINDPSNLFLAIIEICRGFSESNIKSERVAKAWKQKKLDARTGHKVTSACPGWMKLTKNQTFDIVPAKAMAVRRMIELAKSGIGVGAIAKTLNAEGQPTLTLKASYWHSSSVYKTLNNRSLFGEYQPKFANKYQSEKNRKPDGQPIPGYYPPLITEAEFYELQSGMAARRNTFATGRKSTKVTNLFGTLIKDVNTGSTMCRLDKGKKALPCLISSEMKVGIGKRATFSYDHFEFHFLSFLSELPISELTGKLSTESEKELAIVRGRAKEVSAKLQKLKTRLAEESDIDVLMDVACDLETQLKQLRKQEESLKAETARPEPVKECRQAILLLLLNTQEDKQKIELRSRIKFLLAEMIEVMFCHIEVNGQERTLFLDIRFRNKTKRLVLFQSSLVYQRGTGGNPVPKTVCCASSSQNLPESAIAPKTSTDKIATWKQGFNVFLPIPPGLQSSLPPSTSSKPPRKPFARLELHEKG